MSKFACTSTIIVCLLALAPQAFAAKPAKTTPPQKFFYMAPTLGGYILTGSDPRQSAPLVGLKFGYELTDTSMSNSLAVEGTLNFFRTKATGSDNSENGGILRVDAVYPFIFKTKYTPYLALGVGGRFITGSGSSKALPLLNYGAGIRYPLKDNISIRFDARHLLVFENVGTHNSFETSIGFNYYFGKAKPKPVVPPKSIETAKKAGAELKGAESNVVGGIDMAANAGLPISKSQPMADTAGAGNFPPPEAIGPGAGPAPSMNAPAASADLAKVKAEDGRDSQESTKQGVPDPVAVTPAVVPGTAAEPAPASGVESQPSPQTMQKVKERETFSAPVDSVGVAKTPYPPLARLQSGSNGVVTQTEAILLVAPPALPVDTPAAAADTAAVPVPAPGAQPGPSPQPMQKVKEPAMETIIAPAGSGDVAEIHLPVSKAQPMADTAGVVTQAEAIVLVAPPAPSMPAPALPADFPAVAPGAGAVPAPAPEQMVTRTDSAKPAPLLAVDERKAEDAAGLESIPPPKSVIVAAVPPILTPVAQPATLAEEPTPGPSPEEPMQKGKERNKRLYLEEPRDPHLPAKVEVLGDGADGSEPHDYKASLAGVPVSEAVVAVTGPAPPMPYPALPDTMERTRKADMLKEAAPPRVPVMPVIQPAPGAIGQEGRDRAAVGEVLITGISINQDSLEIHATQPLQTYKTLTLSQPSRLVIDIYGGVNSIGTKRIPLHKLGIAAIRFGDHPDFMRVVLDADEGKLLPYRLEETPLGLKILMKQQPE